jgi:hypothetical protein
MAFRKKPSPSTVKGSVPRFDSEPANFRLVFVMVPITKMSDILSINDILPRVKEQLAEGVKVYPSAGHAPMLLNHLGVAVRITESGKYSRPVIQYALLCIDGVVGFYRPSDLTDKKLTLAKKAVFISGG